MLVKLGSHAGANGAAVQADGKIVLAGSAEIDGRGVIMVARVDGGSNGPQPNAGGLPDPNANGNNSATRRRAMAEEAKAGARAQRRHHRRRRNGSRRYRHHHRNGSRRHRHHHPHDGRHHRPVHARAHRLRHAP
jgi:hypothetical protein